jgi:hypothetical protein
VSRSAQDRLTDIQTAIARVYAYRPNDLDPLNVAVNALLGVS